jgi:AdoMet-dependent heme synthase
LARYGRNNGLQTIVSTNGHCVTDDFARQTRRAGLQVQVSLDGASADLHDQVRGPGAFERTLSGIQRLVSRQVFTILSLVCHRENLHALEPFYTLARELGVNEARFIPLKRLGGACKAGLEPVDPKDLVVAAASLFRGHPEFRTLLGRDALSILATTCAHSIRQPSCGTGLRTLLLDANGDLYPCLNTHVPGLRVANIRDSGFDFGRLWTESLVLNRVRQETSLENPQTKCYNCVVRYWCLGYCRGETLQATGSLANRAVDCGRQREAIIETFWLLGTEPDIARWQS